MSDFVSQPNLPSLAVLLVLQQASVVWLGGWGLAQHLVQPQDT